jgi:hypothetical protein
MLKTISAALLAISVLAAPAMAASTAKTAPAPIAKTTAAKTTQAPVIKSVKAKPSVMNANARMGRHHHRFHRYHRHHRFHHRFHRHFHKHMGATKAHQFSKVSVKHVTPALKRG